MADNFPVDFTTPVGRIRKYIPDLIQLPDPDDADGSPTFLFSDDELTSFLADETADGTLPVTGFRIRRAAAWAMIALANSENLILKKIVTQDQQTDGPNVAKQLIAAAAALFSQAEKEEASLVTATQVTEGFAAVFPVTRHRDSLYEMRWLR